MQRLGNVIRPPFSILLKNHLFFQFFRYFKVSFLFYQFLLLILSYLQQAVFLIKIPPDCERALAVIRGMSYWIRWKLEPMEVLIVELWFDGDILPRAWVMKRRILRCANSLSILYDFRSCPNRVLMILDGNFFPLRNSFECHLLWIDNFVAAHDQGWILFISSIIYGLWQAFCSRRASSRSFVYRNLADQFVGIFEVDFVYFGGDLQLRVVVWVHGLKRWFLNWQVKWIPFVGFESIAVDVRKALVRLS